MASILIVELTAAMPVVDKAAAVVGGGPAGLLSAIMLARRGWTKIDVFDALAAPPLADDPCWAAGERSYQIGLNGRGQNALSQFECLDAIDPYAGSVRGRLSFSKASDQQSKQQGAPAASPAASAPVTLIEATVGAANGFTPTEQRLKEPGTPGAEKTYTTRVLQRDRLQACLIAEAAKYPAVKITHGARCIDVDVSGPQPIVRLDASSSAGGYDLVVGADGVRSAVRASLEKVPGSSTQAVRFPNTNERRYKTLPLHPSLVDGTAADLNWGYRNASLGLGMDALPTKEGEMVAVLLMKPDSPVCTTIEGLGTGAEAKAFLADAMPPLLPYLRDEDLANFVKRPVAKLPSFQLVEGDIHYASESGGVVLLGDAIKAVKPYFGQGANSALEDVCVLDRCLEACGDAAPASAAAEFTAVRAKDARALVKISRSFDHPGPLGTARFLLPLLLDIQLNKLLPAFFSPPILRGLQDERNSFTQLVRRKRIERVCLIGSLATLGALIRAAALRPTGPASQALYAMSMVGLGFGGTKAVSFVRNGGLTSPRQVAFGALGSAMRRMSSVAGAPLGIAKNRLRAALLKLDPSLEEKDGETIGWNDLPGRGPRGKRD